MTFDKEDITKKLHEGICKIIFTKTNGDTRIMHCSLNESLLPEQVDLEVVQKKAPNPDVLAVWDVENSGWRSFRWDSVKEFSAEHNL